MNVPCYNTILANEHLDAQGKRDARAEAELSECLSSTFASLDAGDIAETLYCDAMVEAIKTKNVDLIGRVAMHLIDAYCHRCAVLQVYEADVDHRKDEAKAMEMVQAFKEGK